MSYVLKFLDFDGSENRLHDAIYAVRVMFNADSMLEAKEEASRVWAATRETRRKVGWDRREYPREPSLVLEIDWEP